LADVDAGLDEVELLAVALERAHTMATEEGMLRQVFLL
jgi:hypothetical protein